MMKFVVLVAANVAGAALAFAPPSRRNSVLKHHQRQRFQTQSSSSSSSALHLLDPSSISSSTIVTSDLIEGLLTSIGSLALLGSVGFGVYAGIRDDDFDYEYKPTNDEAAIKYSSASSTSSSDSDLALIEVSPADVAVDIVKAEEKTTATKTTISPAQKAFFNKEAISDPAPPPASSAKVTAKPTSDTVLRAAEVAKVEVQKKGVQETKEKMSSKTTTTTSSSATTTSAAQTKDEPEKSNNAATEAKKEVNKGTKQRLVKGTMLIAAAGAVAVARNVVKAWLGRGLL